MLVGAFWEFPKASAGVAAGAVGAEVLAARAVMNKRKRMEGGAREGAVPVETALFTRCKYTKKRHLSKRKYVDKLVSAGFNTYLLRLNGVNRYANPTGGYFNVYNGITTAVDIGRYLPMVYFDLTASVNWTTQLAASEALVFGDAIYRPFIRTTGPPVAQLTFQKNRQPRQDANGAATVGTYSYDLEKGPQTATSRTNGFLRAALHKWTQMKLLCYGTRTQPTRFTVSMVRFHKPHLCPGWTDAAFTATQGNSTTDQNAAEAVALQQYLGYPYGYSPLNIRDPQLHKLYTEVVIKDFVVGQQPNPSPAAPYMHQIDFFKSWNAVRKYDWTQFNASYGNQVALAPDNEVYATTLNKCQPNVDFTKRWYLLIRAQCPQLTSGDVPPTTDGIATPSFDIVIRHRYDELI